MRNRLSYPHIILEDVVSDNIKENSMICVKGETAHYLSRVLRVQKGEIFCVTNGRGTITLAEVAQVTHNSVIFRGLEESNVVEEPTPKIALILSVLDGNDLTDAIEGATEAGVDAIILIRAHRSNRDIPDKNSGTWKRIEKIIRQASSQSKRSHLPSVCTAKNLEDASSMVDQVFFGDPLVSQHLDEHKILDKGVVGVAIGPEGGFTEQEKAYLLKIGGVPLYLGPTILRARTASIVGVHNLVMIREKMKLRKGLDI